MARKAVPSPPKNLVGPQVSKLRYQHGLSQNELAAKCQRLGWNISRGIVAGIEGQVRCVTDLEFALLARVLGTSLDALLPKATREAVVKDFLSRTNKEAFE